MGKRLFDGSGAENEAEKILLEEVKKSIQSLVIPKFLV